MAFSMSQEINNVEEEYKLGICAWRLQAEAQSHHFPAA